MLKAALQRDHPDITSMREGSSVIKEKIAEVLPEIWRSLSPELFQILCASMPRRVAAIRVSKEWYTKY